MVAHADVAPDSPFKLAAVLDFNYYFLAVLLKNVSPKREIHQSTLESEAWGLYKVNNCCFSRFIFIVFNSVFWVWLDLLPIISLKLPQSFHHMHIHLLLNFIYFFYIFFISPIGFQSLSSQFTEGLPVFLTPCPASNHISINHNASHASLSIHLSIFLFYSMPLNWCFHYRGKICF